jgi:hypothetical protein
MRISRRRIYRILNSRSQSQKKPKKSAKGERGRARKTRSKRGGNIRKSTLKARGGALLRSNKPASTTTHAADEERGILLSSGDTLVRFFKGDKSSSKPVKAWRNAIQQFVNAVPPVTKPSGREAKINLAINRLEEVIPKLSKNPELSTYASYFVNREKSLINIDFRPVEKKVRAIKRYINSSEDTDVKEILTKYDLGVGFVAAIDLKIESLEEGFPSLLKDAVSKKEALNKAINHGKTTVFQTAESKAQGRGNILTQIKIAFDAYSDSLRKLASTASLINNLISLVGDMARGVIKIQNEALSGLRNKEARNAYLLLTRGSSIPLSRQITDGIGDYAGPYNGFPTITSSSVGSESNPAPPEYESFKVKSKWNIYARKKLTDLGIVNISPGNTQNVPTESVTPSVGEDVGNAQNVPTESVTPSVGEDVGNAQNVPTGPVIPPVRADVDTAGKGTIEMTNMGADVDNAQNVPTGPVIPPVRADVDTAGKGTIEMTNMGADVDTAQNVSEDTVQNVSEDTAQNVSEDTVQNVSEDTAQNVSQGTARNARMEAPQCSGDLGDWAEVVSEKTTEGNLLINNVVVSNDQGDIEKYIDLCPYDGSQYNTIKMPKNGDCGWLAILVYLSLIVKVSPGYAGAVKTQTPVLGPILESLKNDISDQTVRRILLQNDNLDQALQDVNGVYGQYVSHLRDIIRGMQIAPSVAPTTGRPDQYLTDDDLQVVAKVIGMTIPVSQGRGVIWVYNTPVNDAQGSIVSTFQPPEGVSPSDYFIEPLILNHEETTADVPGYYGGHWNIVFPRVSARVYRRVTNEMRVRFEKSDEALRERLRVAPDDAVGPRGVSQSSIGTDDATINSQSSIGTDDATINSQSSIGTDDATINNQSDADPIVAIPVNNVPGPVNATMVASNDNGMGTSDVVQTSTSTRRQNDGTVKVTVVITLPKNASLDVSGPGGVGYATAMSNLVNDTQGNTLGGGGKKKARKTKSNAKGRKGRGTRKK